MSAVPSPREVPRGKIPLPAHWPAMGGIDRSALASCFKCFDSDNSGGIDLEVSSLHHTPRTTPAPHWSLTTTPLLGTTQELTSAFSALGMPDFAAAQNPNIFLFGFASTFLMMSMFGVDDLSQKILTRSAWKKVFSKSA